MPVSSKRRTEDKGQLTEDRRQIYLNSEWSGFYPVIRNPQPLTRNAQLVTVGIYEQHIEMGSEVIFGGET